MIGLLNNVTDFAKCVGYFEHKKTQTNIHPNFKLYEVRLTVSNNLKKNKKHLIHGVRSKDKICVVASLSHTNRLGFNRVLF